MARPITIDVVSDVVCPWCYIGKKRLEAALDSLPDIEAEVRWRPYQLDPAIPPGGQDRKAYMAGKFGSEERIRQMHERVVALGQAEGIAFDFDAIKVMPNTLAAHRVIRWAQAAGNGVQSRLVAVLFADYFERGRDVGGHDVLAAAAREAGMNASVVEPLLASDADVEAVRDEIGTASRMGITGVPCFLLDGKYAVMGAQEAQTLADAIRQVAEEKVS